MEKHHMATSFDSPLNFFPSSEKQIISNPHKIKNISSSTHRRVNQGSEKVMQRVNKLSNLRKDSTTRKNKSKCETEVHHSVKKGMTQNQSISKKTLRKRKNQKIESLTTNKLKLSHSKNEEQSLTLKSNGKRNWPKKQLFHSTCFSRHLDQDLELLEQVMHGSLDFLVPESACLRNSESNSLKRILQRTNLVLGNYQNRYQQLQKQCNFYKNQLGKANKKLEQFDKKSSLCKKNIKNKQKDSRDYKQSIRSTWTGKNEKY